MRKESARSIVISVCFAFCLASCTNISSTMTYKAISKNNESCKLGKSSNIWLDNTKLEAEATVQYRMFNMMPEITDSQISHARFVSSVLINDFKYNIDSSLNLKINQNMMPTCILTVTPIKTSHDVRGGDSIILESTLSNKISGSPVWSVKIETRATGSDRNMEMLESFTKKLASEIKRDGFNSM